MAHIYSYTRFSAEIQALGDSERRQIAAARAYCEKHGWRLDESIHDHGKSAYHGRHRKAGAFGLLMERIQTGKIAAGSILLVEGLDRLSREEPLLAFRSLSDIVLAGIEVHTLMDGERYTRANMKTDPWRIMKSIMAMVTAHEESAKKSERVKASWLKRRSSAMTVTPSWIVKTANGEPVRTLEGLPSNVVRGVAVVEAKAEVVRRIFKLVLADGVPEVARILNREGVPSLRNARWDSTTLLRIVRGRSALGEQKVCHVVNGKQVPTGEVVKAFPAIITEKTWLKAQAALDKRVVSGGVKGRNVAQVTNLFGDLARCAACGGRMHVKNFTRRQGARTYGYKALVCGGARTGVCENHRTHRLAAVEAHMANVFRHLVPAPKREDPGQARKNIEARVVAAQAEAARLQRAINRMAGNVGDDPSLMAAMQNVADQRKAALAEVAARESDLAAVVAQSAGGDDVRETLTAGIDTREDRARVAAALPAVLERMIFKADGTWRAVLKNDWFVMKDGRLTRAVRPEAWEEPAVSRRLPRRKGEDVFAHAAREMGADAIPDEVHPLTPADPDDLRRARPAP